MPVSNLLSKLLSGASNVAGRAEDSLMPAPADGLFSQQDIAAARKQGLLHLGLSLLGDTSGMGLGSALKNGAQDAQGAYSGSLQGAQQQKTLQQQQNILKQRAAIGQKYMPQPGDTAKDIFARYPAMYADYMRAGDLEAAKNIEGIVSQQVLHGDGDKKQAVQAGDRIYTFDPNTGTYTPGPERHMNQDELTEKALDRAMKIKQMDLMGIQRNAALGTQAANAFARQNKPLLDTESLYQGWQNAYRDAKAGNPAAYKSALMNFAAIADPKLQIRLGTLNFASKVDPSLMGQAQIAMQRNANGTFPAKILDEMNDHVKNMHRGTISIYNSRRAARVKANPMLESYIDPAESVFPSAADLNQAYAPPNASESRVSQFLKGFGVK